MDRSRSISSGEARAWNNEVEQRRREYHEQRCADNELYRRAYERLQEERRQMQRQMGKYMVQIADAVNEDCQQRVNSVMENIEQQPVKTHEEVMRDRALMDSVIKNPEEWMAQGVGFGLGFAIAAMMFADSEKMKQRMKELEEERPYLEEIKRADDSFDKELICMSGFEW